MESEKNIIKYIRQQQAEDLVPINKSISDMNDRITICQGVINNVPEHEQSVLDGHTISHINWLRLQEKT